MKFAIKWTVDSRVKVIAVLLMSMLVQPVLTDNGDPSGIQASRHPLEALSG